MYHLATCHTPATDNQDKLKATQKSSVEPTIFISIKELFDKVCIWYLEVISDSIPRASCICSTHNRIKIVSVLSPIVANRAPVLLIDSQNGNRTAPHALYADILYELFGEVLLK